MSLKSNKSLPAAMDGAEPKADSSPAPILLIGLMALLAYWGMLYLEKNGGGFNGQVYTPYVSYADVDDHQPPHIVDPRVLGQKIFSANCVACHQASGLGVPGQFPPLVGSEWVNAKSPNRIIRIVLNGLTGPIKVKDQPFNNTMVPWKDTLTDEQIAAVLTFVRQNKEWSNDASLVTPEQVKAIHEKIKDRSNAFTPDELLKLPEGQ